MTNETAIKELIALRNQYSVYRKTQAIQMAITALEGQKTGRWVITEEFYNDCAGYFKQSCSECGFVAPMDKTYYYCPFCGAKMEDVD